MSIGSCILAGFIFKFCYYRKGEDDDELSEGLRSPDGLYKAREVHPFNPVTVAFLSKPNPSVNGTCGNHFDPSYGYIASAAPGCYHEYDYGYDSYSMCNAAHPMPGQMMSHLQQTSSVQNNSLGKPPNEEEEDAYLEQNPEERENYNKNENNEINKYGCVQCGQIKNQCCGCESTALNKSDKIIDQNQLTRAILEQYADQKTDSLNGTVVGIINYDCGTPATTTTTTGRTSSNATNNEDDDEQIKSSNESNSNLETNEDLNNLHTTFIKQNDLGSEDSIEETSDEHIAILNHHKSHHKEQYKKWRNSSSSSIDTSNHSSSTNCSNNLKTINSIKSISPSKNKSNVPLLIESQTEQFQIA